MPFERLSNLGAALIRRKDNFSFGTLQELSNLSRVRRSSKAKFTIGERSLICFFGSTAVRTNRQINEVSFTFADPICDCLGQQ